MMSEQKKTRSPLAIVLIVSTVFFALFLMISGAFVFLKSPVGRYSLSGAVGVVPITGIIMDSKKTLRKLEKFEDDPSIKAVVLRLNSPGGAVAPSQEIYQAVKNYKKPLVISMGAVAASGAYYIACGAKKIFANPGTITGSIGVIMQFANLERLYEWAKVRRYVIKTGKFKDTGSEFREMQPEEKVLLQGMVDDVLRQFKDAVAQGRKLSSAQVAQVADGRIFSGSQAKAAKLVDELGTLRDAIQEAAGLAQIKGKPTVVYPEPRKRKWLEFLMNDRSDDDDADTDVETSGFSWIDSVIQAFRKNWTNPSSNLGPGVYWIWQES